VRKKPIASAPEAILDRDLADAGRADPDPGAGVENQVSRHRRQPRAVDDGTEGNVGVEQEVHRLPLSLLVQRILPGALTQEESRDILVVRVNVVGYDEQALGDADSALDGYLGDGHQLGDGAAVAGDDDLPLRACSMASTSRERSVFACSMLMAWTAGSGGISGKLI
jgi:hypothetical protein